MNTENEILTDLRRIRDEHAEECGYDIHRVFAELRAETARLKAEGWKVVSFADEAKHGESCVVREEPPKPKQP